MIMANCSVCLAYRWPVHHFLPSGGGCMRISSFRTSFSSCSGAGGVAVVTKAPGAWRHCSVDARQQTPRGTHVRYTQCTASGSPHLSALPRQPQLSTATTHIEHDRAHLLHRCRADLFTAFYHGAVCKQTVRQQSADLGPCPDIGFSVQVFGTFFCQKVDERWTTQRGRTVAKRVAHFPNRENWQFQLLVSWASVAGRRPHIVLDRKPFVTPRLGGGMGDVIRYRCRYEFDYSLVE